jgi:protein-L-isoaspartate(D-aspartate) O-methyltransferase
MPEFAARRLNMIESQLRTNKVTDARILRAMGELPRELFVPAELRGIAYVDEDIAIGNDRFMLEPMVLARLVQAAQIEPASAVLEIGTGTGYGAAVMARLASTVIAVESDGELAAAASRHLAAAGVDNVVVVRGPLREGVQKHQPYAAIVFSGAVDFVPSAIQDQLAEGGRLVAVVRGRDGIGRATLMQRRRGAIASTVLFDAHVPNLSGFTREPSFVL